MGQDDASAPKQAEKFCERWDASEVGQHLTQLGQGLIVALGPQRQWLADWCGEPGIVHGDCFDGYVEPHELDPAPWLAERRFRAQDIFEAVCLGLAWEHHQRELSRLEKALAKLDELVQPH